MGGPALLVKEFAALANVKRLELYPIRLTLLATPAPTVNLPNDFG